MNFDSFSTAPWFDHKVVYHAGIGGIGNIGSWTSLMLSRMGFKLFLFDMDNIELRNISSQLYPRSHIGTLKTHSMVKTIKELTGTSHNIIALGKYDEDSPIFDISIAVFDNMKARKIMFDKWVDFQNTKRQEILAGTREKIEGEVNMFIDGRSLAELGIVYAINSPKDVERYKEELFDDDEVEDQVCSFKSTSHNGMMVASVITALITNQITNKKFGKNFRSVPFKVEFELPVLSFRTHA
jgi:hypothetical protein